MFSPLLYELVVGDVNHWEIAPLYTELLQGTGAKFKMMDIGGIDVKGGKVFSGKGEGGEVVEWDKAVVALGGEEVGWKGPGDGEVLRFKSVGDALLLKERLGGLLDGVGRGRLIKMFVVGGGYSGVELATSVAEKWEGRVEVVLVERGDRVLKNSSGWNRRVGERALDENKVVVEYGMDVKRIDKDRIVLNRKKGGGEVVYDCDVVVWTAGVKPSSILEGMDVEKDENGRIVADGQLKVKGYENVLALGDCASVQGPQGEFKGTAQVAMQQAEYAAWNMWAHVCGKPMLDFKYSHLGEMMVLGSSNGTLSTPFGVNLNGSLAHAVRRAAYLMRLPTDSHRARVAASWATSPILSTVENLFGSSRRGRTSEL